MREHRRILESLGAEVREIRGPEEVDGIAALVIPGGESSVMDKLCRLFGLYKPLRERIVQGMPVLGTCAGMILLAGQIEDAIEGQESLGGLDITVKRNAFGAQRESFDTSLSVPALGIDPVDVSFIRAPQVTRVGPQVEVWATLPDQSVVAVDNGQCTALAFHPEITGETRFHQLLLERAGAFSASV